MAVRVKGSTPTPISDPPFKDHILWWEIDPNQDLSDKYYSYSGHGISGLGAGLANFRLDAARNIYNFLESVGNFFASKPQAPEGKGWGNRLFGHGLPQDAGAAKVKGTGAVNQAKNNQDQKGADLPDAMTFADFMALAQMMGGGGGVDYRPLMESARRNHALGDARLAALYSRLQEDIAGDRPGIQQTYDTATQSIGQAGADTRALINAAYESANQQRAQQLAALGIADAALRDNYTAGNQAAAIARTAERQNISQNQLADNLATSLNYNTQIGQAVGQQGAAMRAALERALYDRLAELEMAQSEADARARSNVFDMAFRMASNPALFDPVISAQAAAQQDFENQMEAARLALEQYKVMGSRRTLEEILGIHNQVADMAQRLQIGNDPESMAAFIEYLKSLGWTP